MDAEADACFLIDSIGAELAGYGVASTLRDLARFGEAMRCDDACNGRHKARRRPRAFQGGGLFDLARLFLSQHVVGDA
jgi:CubicO group peptidase (beta-lactamase class C family)